MAILKAAPILLLFVFAGPELLGCDKKLSGDTSFKEANKRFETELTRDQRKTAIKQLQTETAR